MCAATFMITEAVLNISDFDENMDRYILAICAILGIVKCISFRMRRPDFGENISSIVEDLLLTDDEQTKGIVTKYVFLGRKFYLTLLTVMCPGCVSFVLPGILSNFIPLKVISNGNGSQDEVVRLFTLPVTTIFESSKMSSSIYILTCIWLTLLLLALSFGNIGSDLYYFALTIYLCGQFESLKEKLVDFPYGTLKRGSPHEIMSTKRRKLRIQSNMKVLIKRHCHLLQLATHLQEAASLVLLVQLFLTSLSICVVGFKMILAVKDQDLFLTSKGSIVICLVIMQVYMYCFVGDYLTCQIEDIAISAYGCQWMEIPRNLTIDVQLIISRAYKPFHLTAGGVFTINMNSFMSLLKTSFSYLNVLRFMLLE